MPKYVALIIGRRKSSKANHSYPRVRRILCEQFQLNFAWDNRNLVTAETFGRVFLVVK